MPAVYTYIVTETREVKVTAESPLQAVAKTHDQTTGWETTDVSARKEF